LFLPFIFNYHYYNTKSTGNTVCL